MQIKHQRNKKINTKTRSGTRKLRMYRRKKTKMEGKKGKKKKEKTPGD